MKLYNYNVMERRGQCRKPAAMRHSHKMTERPKDILLCTCEDTMPLDADAVRRACHGADSQNASNCAAPSLSVFVRGGGARRAVIIGCTQEAPLFSETAGEAQGETDLIFVNVRETAGWSEQAADAGPKMAALIAAAGERRPDVPFISLMSDGVILIYGRDEQAIEAGNAAQGRIST